MQNVTWKKQISGLTGGPLSPLWIAVQVGALSLAGCGDDSSGLDANAGAAAQGDAGDAVVTRSGFLDDAGDGWKVLLEADWEIAPGEETYRCVHFTVPEDVSLVRFKPLSPLGTHHTTMGVFEEAQVEDGITTCTAGGGGDRRLVGSGVGTQESPPFPEGVTMELAAGNQLLMNLHLFNTSDEILKGTSGVLVQVGEPAEPEFQASTVLAGPLRLSIPPGKSMQEGDCTFQKAATVFSVMPHMHQLGTHLTATAQRAGHDPEVIFDDNYDFDQQVSVGIQPLQMAAGDKLHVSCAFENTTDATVTFGNSSLDEMCFASLAFYPSSAFNGRPCAF